MSFPNEKFWEVLLDRIDNGFVLPVVGQGVTTIQPEDELLAPWLTATSSPGFASAELWAEKWMAERWLFVADTFRIHFSAIHFSASVFTPPAVRSPARRGRAIAIIL